MMSPRWEHRSVQAGSMGQGQLYEVQPGQVPGPALGSHQPHGMLQASGSLEGVRSQTRKARNQHG